MQNKLREAEGILNESKETAQRLGLQNSTESDSVMEPEDALIDPFQDLQNQINDIIE
jgi:hypothetical protein